MYCVYCITRDDGKKYIGKAKNIKGRISIHKKTKRFKRSDIFYEILFISEDHSLVCDAEEFFVKYFYTFENGLNLTKDGSGNNYTEKFTTFGLKWSDETKRKIKFNHADLSKNKNGMWGKKHSNDTLIKWSKLRKNKVWSKKFTEKNIEEILNIFKTTPNLKSVGTIQKNGKILTYNRAFCKEYCNDYNMSAANMKKIIEGKTLAWKQLFEKIMHSKS